MGIFLLPTAPDIFVLAYKVTLVASERWGVLAFFNRHLLMFFLREDFYIRQANHWYLAILLTQLHRVAVVSIISLGQSWRIRGFTFWSSQEPKTSWWLPKTKRHWIGGGKFRRQWWTHYGLQPRVSVLVSLFTSPSMVTEPSREQRSKILHRLAGLIWGDRGHQLTGESNIPVTS